MSKKVNKLDIDKVPFVPALDLLEKEENKLSEAEAAAVGLAIFLCIGKTDEKSCWQLNSYAEALESRL